MNQSEFARFIGISRQSIGFYESGSRLPDASTIRLICDKCNVSADWLLGVDIAVEINRKNDTGTQSFDSKGYDDGCYAVCPSCNSSNIGLKFIGNEYTTPHGRVYKTKPLYYVQCQVCGMRTANFRDSEDAIKSWNRREQ